MTTLFVTFLELEPHILSFREHPDHRRPAEHYCPRNATDKSRKQPLAKKMHWAFTAILFSDGRILIAGGTSCRAKAYSSTKFYDPYTKRYEPGPPLKKRRCFAAAALLNNCIYICGGCPTRHCDQYLNRCERLNANKSTKIEPMKEKRGGFAMVAFEKKLYAFGGDGPRSALSSVECYDPDKKFWSIANPMSTTRVYPAASVLGNRIYVCGGMNKHHRELRSCERYDPAEDAWERVARMRKARIKHCLVTLRVNFWLTQDSIREVWTLHF